MDNILYTATIEILSPLHIGTGTALLQDVDWIQQGNSLYVADQDRLLETVLERVQANRQGDDADAIRAITGMNLSDLRQAGWLTRDDFGAGSPLFRYSLRGKPAMNQVAEQIKDVYGRPYLPGSSLKGALRTVLAVGGASVQKADLSRPGRSRSWAAQPIEREIFGPDPHHDLLRALQVSDSQSIAEGAPLELARVNVFPTAQQTSYGRSQGLDLDVEALRKGMRLTATVKLDGSLFGDDTPWGRYVESELSFGKRQNWLLSLPQWARTIAGRRLATEADFYGGKRDGDAARGFCLRLAAVWNGLQENEFLLQVGWGTGWQSKTFGTLLQQDPRAFEGLVRKYNLSSQDRKRKAGQPFPKSRKLVRRGEKAVEPLGWVKVTLERQS